MSLGHQEGDLALKLPVITYKDGSRLLMPLKSLSKVDKNKSNSLLFCLGGSDKSQTLLPLYCLIHL